MQGAVFGQDLPAEHRDTADADPDFKPEGRLFTGA